MLNLELEIVAVQCKLLDNNNNIAFAITDLNHPDGNQLRTLYKNNNNVTGFYAFWENKGWTIFIQDNDPYDFYSNHLYINTKNWIKNEISLGRMSYDINCIKRSCPSPDRTHWSRLVELYDLKIYTGLNQDFRYIYPTLDNIKRVCFFGRPSSLMNLAIK